MAATITKVSLSGSANYNLIAVNAASSPGVTIHTAVSGNAVENQSDEVWIWAYNASTAGLTLTVEWAQTIACLISSVPTRSGYSLVVPGIPLSNAYVVRAYGQNASQIYLSGFVNQIRP
mgnify:CR=1 FL=1